MSNVNYKKKASKELSAEEAYFLMLYAIAKSFIIATIVVAFFMAIGYGVCVMSIGHDACELPSPKTVPTSVDSSR